MLRYMHMYASVLVHICKLAASYSDGTLSCWFSISQSQRPMQFLTGDNLLVRET